MKRIIAFIVFVLVILFGLYVIDEFHIKEQPDLVEQSYTVAQKDFIDSNLSYRVAHIFEDSILFHTEENGFVTFTRISDRILWQTEPYSLRHRHATRFTNEYFEIEYKSESTNNLVRLDYNGKVLLEVIDFNDNVVFTSNGCVFSRENNGKVFIYYQDETGEQVLFEYDDYSNDFKASPITTEPLNIVFGLGNEIVYMFYQSNVGRLRYIIINENEILLNSQLDGNVKNISITENEVIVENYDGSKDVFSFRE